MVRHLILLTVIAIGFLVPQRVSSDEPTAPTFEEPKTYEEALSHTEETAGFKNLQRIGLAFHLYHDVFGRFPPAVLIGPDGKTPYSWRVEILPMLKHLEEPVSGKTDREQYDKLIAACGYDTSQSWNSPKNRWLLEHIPPDFRHPSDNPQSTNAAYYAVVGAGTVFDPDGIARYTDIKGWPATALMIVESRSQEPWTKPIDIGYSQTSAVPRFGGFTKHGFLALSCDGAVHFISEAVAPDTLRGFISKDPNDTFTIIGIPFRYDP